MGLTVSFDENFKRDKRCNARSISKKINTFRSDSSRHKASSVSFYHINCGVLCKNFELQEKPYQHMLKHTTIFSCVFDIANQLLTRHSSFPF